MHEILPTAITPPVYHESSFSLALRLSPDDSDSEDQGQREDRSQQDAPQLLSAEEMQGLGQQHA